MHSSGLNPNPAAAALRNDFSQPSGLATCSAMKASDLPQVRALSVADKLRLVEDLWNDLAARADSLPLPEWHARELDQDLEAYRRDPLAGSDWAEVQARILHSR
jgi:putative addiction module component (TIGR02574 family)